MTRLAFPGNWALRGVSGLVEEPGTASADSGRASNEANPKDPIPIPALLRKSRRFNIQEHPTNNRRSKRIQPSIQGELDCQSPYPCSHRHTFATHPNLPTHISLQSNICDLSFRQIWEEDARTLISQGMIPGDPNMLNRPLLADRTRTRFPVQTLFQVAGTSQYRLRLATTEEDVKSAQTLRFLVFNLELREGLESSYLTFRDEDAFDPVCDHLLVETVENGEVIGTYRLQPGSRAAESGLGYYSEQEFDFRPFERHRHEMIELGRACVLREHRNTVVLGLLWKGIAAYARMQGGRYLIGCSSLTSQDPGEGTGLYQRLRERHLAPPEWQTEPLPAWRCFMTAQAPEIRPPKLLTAYLSLGARICGPPALDRTFKTIDFLTLLDLERISEVAARRFLRP